MILLLIRKLLASKFGAHIGIDIAVLLIALASYGVYKHFSHNPITSVTQVTPDVKVVTVDKPVITEKIVDRIVSDPKDKAVIAALLAENKKLNAETTVLTQTIAELKSHGGGTVTMIPPGCQMDTHDKIICPPTDPPVVTPPNPNDGAWNFKDYHLSASFRPPSLFSYDLTQKFEILTTSGKLKDGQPIANVKLFEIDGKGDRIPVADVKTTAIFSDQTATHWFTHTNLQAGVAFTKDPDGKTSNGGLVVLQWLKRGKTKAPEDIGIAVLSPTFFFSQDVKEPGLLPVSLNLGRVPHQPLTNLWVSPYLGVDIFGRHLSRVGVVFSATF